MIDLKKVLYAIIFGIICGFICSQVVFAQNVIGLGTDKYFVQKYFGKTWRNSSYPDAYTGYSSYSFSDNHLGDLLRVVYNGSGVTPLMGFYDFVSYNFSFNSTSDPIDGQPIVQTISSIGDVSCIFTQSSVSSGGSYNVNVNAYCPIVLTNQLNANEVLLSIKHSATEVQTFYSGSFTFYSTNGDLYSYFDKLNGQVDSNNQLLQQLISKLNGFSSQAIIDNQNQNTQKEIDNANKNHDELMNNLNNSDSSGAKGDADSFFSGFESDDFGLSSIVTAPLNLIKSITSSTCKPIGFTAPFVNQEVTLPCMSGIYDKYFGDFFKIYQTITFGMVAYWVCVNIFFMVKGFKDPDSDRIEVLDL